MLELYQLIQLTAIAECGTLSGAAEQLHLSQPALSRSMQKLEDTLQVTLFDRQKNKIHLNRAGELAVAQARRVIQQADDMVEQVRAFDRSQRTVSIGSCAPAPPVGADAVGLPAIPGNGHLLRAKGAGTPSQRTEDRGVSIHHPPPCLGGSGLFLFSF